MSKKWLIIISSVVLVGIIIVVSFMFSSGEEGWVVINREEGSGTKGTVHYHLLKPDDFSLKCEQQSSNAAVAQAIATIDRGIGYVAHGYPLPDGARAVSINGVVCSKETILSGEYLLTRTLYFITKGEPDEDEKAFIYWCQNQGQTPYLEQSGYITIAEAQAAGFSLNGNIIAPKSPDQADDPFGGWTPDDISECGSTTVFPLAQAWELPYEDISGVSISVQAGGSSFGVQNVGAPPYYDIGAISRELYENSEADLYGLIAHPIAVDGVSIVVSSHVYDELGVTDLSTEQMRNIFLNGSGTPILVNKQ